MLPGAKAGLLFATGSKSGILKEKWGHVPLLKLLEGCLTPSQYFFSIVKFFDKKKLTDVQKVTKKDYTKRTQRTKNLKKKQEKQNWKKRIK